MLFQNKALAIKVLLLLVLPIACVDMARMDSKSAHYSVDITRTAGGIPHIVAKDIGSLGFGTLYAMAEDNVCYMAEYFQVLAAEQSRYFGAEEGRLESDYFYQLLIDRKYAEEAITADLEALYQGGAEGYNHYLSTVGVDALPDKSCAGKNWVKPVSTIDVKRISRIDIFLDYLKPIIVAAAPPTTIKASTSASENKLADKKLIALAVNAFLEKPKEGGSNAIALGSEATESGAGMLLANPHVAWHEKFLRFYPMHHTIPGKLDIVGANMIGRPRVGFGATKDIAWSNTVSTAKRMTFYRLDLVAGKADHYLFDGKEYAMQEEQVTVSVLAESGEYEQRSHRFYSTHFGAMLVKSDFFDWNEEHAFAVKTIDVGWRAELSAFEQYQAKSVQELKAIHDKYQFMTVNLIAVDRNGAVLYAEPGPVPYITDTQMADCSILYGAAFDGSRSACQWADDSNAVEPGIYGSEYMPFLFRQDYVTNSNDSYWLANPEQPINDQYPSIIGNNKSERTLRTRSGLSMLQRLLQSSKISDGRINLAELQQLMFSNENYAGQMIRDDLVQLCRDTPTVTLEATDKSKALTVDLSEACNILAAWDLHSNLNSKGSHLFREFLAALNDYKFTRYLPTSLNAKVVFDLNDPINTPNGLDQDNNAVALTGLAKAIIRLKDAGLDLDAPLAKVQYVVRNEKLIPIHGGQEIEGVFNKIESDFVAQKGYPEVSRWSSSWIMATDFSNEWPEVKGLLSYSISLNPESPYYSDQTEMYSQKKWLDIPFSAEEVKAAAIRHYTVQSR